MIRAIGTNVYAGGMARGVRDAGIDVFATLEPAGFSGFGEDSVATNLEGCEFVFGEDEWRPSRFRGAVDLVFGNPPCAGFSIIGRRHDGSGSSLRDGYVGHVMRTVRLIDEVKPRVWVIESVNRIETAGAGVCAAIEYAARDAGYSVTYWRHDHRAFGGVQRRQRTFAIVHDVALRFPGVPDESEDLRVVRDVIDGPVGEYEPFTEKNAAMWRLVKPGQNRREILDELESALSRDEIRETYGGRPSFMDVRLDRDDFAPTMIGDPGKYCHPDEVRPLGLFEMGRVAGYPNDWRWTAKRIADNWAYMSKACQPIPARALGDVVVRSLEDDARPTYAVAILDQRYDSRKKKFRDEKTILAPSWDLVP